jgi:hypothetical protein
MKHNAVRLWSDVNINSKEVIKRAIYFKIFILASHVPGSTHMFWLRMYLEAPTCFEWCWWFSSRISGKLLTQWRSVYVTNHCLFCALSHPPSSALRNSCSFPVSHWTDWQRYLNIFIIYCVLYSYLSIDRLLVRFFMKLGGNLFLFPLVQWLT